VKEIVLETTFSSYRTQSILGEGGSGTVYEVKDGQGQFYALKILKNDGNLSTEKIKRFKNEINFSLFNQHRNILTILDHGYLIINQIKIPFYVMPIYDSSLKKVIAKSILPTNVIPLISQILDGMEAAHLLKVIHRDLKPENILYDSRMDKIVIADFGIAHFNEDEIYTEVETKGTTRLANFQYAAPEQRKRGQPIDHRVDIFALGLIFNEIFTKEIPYGTKYKTIKNVAPDFQYLDEIVEKMISNNPADRPNSINEIRHMINISSNEFLTNQKVDQLSKRVVKTSELVDLLIENPVTITDFEWNPFSELLTLNLSQNINNRWINALMNMQGGYTSVLGIGPERFKLIGNKATVKVEESNIQRVIDYFKQWLPIITRTYMIDLENEQKAKEAEERQKNQVEKEKLESKKRVLQTIRI
jgi:serine/threonine protein kinase